MVLAAKALKENSIMIMIIIIIIIFNNATRKEKRN